MGLITARQLDTSPPQWLVDGMLPLTGTGFLWGRRGIGKSLVADVELALAVANGTPFFGRPVEQGSVVVCLGEGLYDAGVRLQGRIQRHQRDEGPQPYDSSRVLIETSPFPLALQRNTFGITIGEVAYEHALQRFRQIPDLGLLVIDPLARFTRGVSVTAASSAGRIADGINRLATELECAVLIVAHPTARGDRMLGERLEDSADFVIEVIDGDPLPGDPASATLIATKAKYGAAFDPVTYRLEPVSWEEPELDDAGEPTGQLLTVTTMTVRADEDDGMPELAEPLPRRRRNGLRLLRRTG